MDDIKAPIHDADAFGNARSDACRDATETTCTERSRSPIAIAAVGLTACLGATLLMAGFAHAEPLMPTTASLSQTSLLADVSAVIAFGLGDERALFGILTFGFSLAAATLWHRSFRSVAKSKLPTTGR